MRNIISGVLFILAIASCNKPSNPTPNPNPNPQNPNPPGNPTTGYWWKFIPNWYNGDTLVGEIYDNSGGFPKLTGRDTIYTFSNLDTSYIIHKGVKYYVWTARYDMNNPADTFHPNTSFYTNVYVNTKVDTLNAFSSDIFSQADPYKYIDANGQWKHGKQRLNLDYRAGAPFKANNTLFDNTGTYWGLNVK